MRQYRTKNTELSWLWLKQLPDLQHERVGAESGDTKFQLEWLHLTDGLKRLFLLSFNGNATNRLVSLWPQSVCEYHLILISRWERCGLFETSRFFDFIKRDGIWFASFADTKFVFLCKPVVLWSRTELFDGIHTIHDRKWATQKDNDVSRSPISESASKKTTKLNVCSLCFLYSSCPLHHSDAVDIIGRKHCEVEAIKWTISAVWQYLWSTRGNQWELFKSTDY